MADKEARFNGRSWRIRCYCGSVVTVDPMQMDAFCPSCGTVFLVYVVRKNGAITRVMLEETTE